MKARENKTGEVLVEPLTRREREVLILLAQGSSSPEIAQQLTLALSSVKWYVQQVYSKLGVNNKQRAILRAGELGLLDTHSSVTSVHFNPKHNLPSQLTSFIGREQDIERIQHRLAEHRLVTLIGVGGIGKTRLSQQVANLSIDNYTDGVWLVEFAALNDPLLVPQSVATLLGIQHRGDDHTLVETLIHFLHAKTLLLMLDNCEHLLDACAELTDRLLKSCPNLKILATSREALGMIGEALYQVPSLTIPDIQQISPIEKLNHYESIRLFHERAQLVQMDFALTKDNASSVTQICSRLDGIPLAIELAAVRVRTFSAEQIAEQLDQCFHVLTGGSRTALPKHQTLQASIDWSWRLLRDVEQILLRRLSVFAGGWTLAAGQAVCLGDGVEADAVLDLMTQLVNKSLVISERKQGNEARYHVLETIRQYAGERLLEAGEGKQLRNRHLDFFLRWAEQVEPEVRGPQQLKWLDQLESELDNLTTCERLWNGARRRLSTVKQICGWLVCCPYFGTSEVISMRGLPGWRKCWQAGLPLVLAACEPKRSMGLASWHVGRVTVWQKLGPDWKKVRVYGESLGWQVGPAWLRRSPRCARACGYSVTQRRRVLWRMRQLRCAENRMTVGVWPMR